jgi:hypothetical protein
LEQFVAYISRKIGEIYVFKGRAEANLSFIDKKLTFSRG